MIYVSVFILYLASMKIGTSEATYIYTFGSLQCCFERQISHIRASQGFPARTLDPH